MHNSFDSINPDLLAAQNRAYIPSNLTVKNLLIEAESQQYGACTFEINNKIIKFRIAKIRPTKIGQFVTLWKRIGDGPILPYDLADSVDFFVVSVRSEHHLGQFVFPKKVLYQKGFVSKEGKGGKRAMRVYPPWDIPESLHAKKTQVWQLVYFFQIKPGVDSAKIIQLFI